MPPHYLISSIFSSFLSLYLFFRFWHFFLFSLILVRASSHSLHWLRKNKKKTAATHCTVVLFLTLLGAIRWNILTCTESSRLYILDRPRLLKHWSEECCGALWSYLPPRSLPKKKQRSWSSHSPKVCGVFVDVFPLPLTMYMLYSYMLHDEIVHTWMCLPLHFCCVRAAAEWANEHWVKCRPSCVLTGTGGVPQRSHFRTHWVLCTVLWSSVIYSVFVTKQRLIAP